MAFPAGPSPQFARALRPPPLEDQSKLALVERLWARAQCETTATALPSGKTRLTLALALRPLHALAETALVGRLWVRVPSGLTAMLPARGSLHLARPLLVPPALAAGVGVQASRGSTTTELAVWVSLNLAHALRPLHGLATELQALWSQFGDEPWTHLRLAQTPLDPTTPQESVR